MQLDAWGMEAWTAHRPDSTDMARTDTEECFACPGCFNRVNTIFPKEFTTIQFQLAQIHIFTSAKILLVNFP
jgi:hypothetical protein